MVMGVMVMFIVVVIVMVSMKSGKKKITNNFKLKQLCERSLYYNELQFNGYHQPVFVK